MATRSKSSRQGRGRIERRRASSQKRVTAGKTARGSALEAAPTRRLGYAVVALGHIAQVAVLPAFEHTQNAKLVALVSSDDEKLEKLGRLYKVKHRFHYDEFDRCLELPEVDAVYIALPNDQHAAFAVRAAKKGKHVLCEKPMDVTEGACRRMMRACEEADVKLMIAYRLHFEPANLEAVELARGGTLGEPKFFSSNFSYQVQPHNIRTREERGGGPTWDIGIYCINAARYLFGADPVEVFAFATSGTGTGAGADSRFREVEETTSCVMRFPEGRTAIFNVSYGASPTSSYSLVGSKGSLRLESAYEYIGDKELVVTVDEKTRRRKFGQVDQFAAELEYFGDCIAQDRPPEPGGYEGWMDVRIIRAIHESATHGRPVPIEPLPHPLRPTRAQKLAFPPVKEKPKTVKVEAPSQ